MVFDYTITLMGVIDTLSILAGGLFALTKISNKVDTKIALLHADFITVKSDIIDMKAEIRKVNDILVRMNAADVRIERAEMDIRELRHGKGFVQGDRGVDHEWPGK